MGRFADGGIPVGVIDGALGSAGGLRSGDPRTTSDTAHGSARTLALRTSVSSRVELAWMAGHDLDRFSRYGFDSFDNPLHGYPTASIRYDRGASCGVQRRGPGAASASTRLATPRWCAIPVGASAAARYPGVGVGVESGGPFRTLLSVEWGYGFQRSRIRWWTRDADGANHGVPRLLSGCRIWRSDDGSACFSSLLRPVVSIA